MNIEKSTKRFINLKERINSIPLTKKVVVLIVIGIIIPLLLLNGTYLYWTRKYILNKTINVSEVYMQQIASNLENHISTYKDMANIRYLDEKLRRYLTYDYELDTKEGVRKYIEAYEYIKNILKEIRIIRDEIPKVTLYVEPSMFPKENDYVQYLDKKCEEREWYRKLKASQADMVMVSEYDYTSQKECLYVASSLRLKNVSDAHNIILLQIDQTRLWENISPKYYKGDLYIYGYDGDILLSNNNDQEATELKKYMKPRNRDESANTIDVSMTEDKALIIVDTVSEQFGMINIIPKEEYMESIDYKILILQSIIFITSVFVVGMIWITIKMFVKGLQDITGIIEKIDAKDLDVHIENKRKDEIGSIINCIIDMSRRIQNLIEKGYKRDLKLKQSELDILQEQLNPHFLYNTLSSLQALILKENKMESMRLIKELSEFYRLCLNKGQSTIGIQDELRLIQAYINIQNIRFHNTIWYEYDMQCEGDEFRLPKLLLQPFIENSIQHGKEGPESVLNIHIKIEKLQEEKYLIQIEDDGIGIGQYYEGYGLKNVRQRMQLYFEESDLKLERMMPRGTRVVLYISKIEGE